VGGRYANKYLASFVGIGPISDPRLVVGVVVDEPVGGHYGGDVAGPVFSEVMGGALRTLGVPQDKEIAPAVVKTASAVASQPVANTTALAKKKGGH
jgi:cell division protein FtsI (penicillin-binding protein 3)